MKTQFHASHEQIDADPLKELIRRRQLWASCPDSDGGALKPEAQIVPLATVHAAIGELQDRRKCFPCAFALGALTGATALFVISVIMKAVT